jgi:hypothetical protein
MSFLQNPADFAEALVVFRPTEPLFSVAALSKLKF